VTVDERWEAGSEFHWPDFSPDYFTKTMVDSNLPASSTLWGSGREAIKALLKWGANEFGWRRFWVPTYFCQQVIGSLDGLGMPILRYDDDPSVSYLAPPQEASGGGDVVLVVNYFGLRTRPHEMTLGTANAIIEDHTHDPWSEWALASNADYCIASLRKTLPVPDGGVLWSPNGLPMPPQIEATTELMIASYEKLAAMVLKSLFLGGFNVSKDQYRSVAKSGENRFGADSGTISGMTHFTQALIKCLPVDRIRMARKENHRTLCSLLADVDWLTVLSPEDASCCPLCLAVTFETENHRELMRHELIANRVYPAVLWDLEEPSKSAEGNIPEEQIEFSRRILSIHCDMRYDRANIEAIGSIVLVAGRNLAF